MYWIYYSIFENCHDCFLPRELSKIQLQYLSKYRSAKDHQNTKNSSSILWKHYLNKFGEEHKVYDANMINKLKQNKQNENVDELAISKMMESTDYIGGCNYILNAKFIASILTNCKQFINKQKVTYIYEPSRKFSATIIEITDKFMYNGFNLLGENFDILDTFKGPHFKQYELRKDLQEEDSAFYERRQSIQLPDSINTQQDDEELIEIDLPIYDTTIEENAFAFDLSINCVHMSLLTIKRVIDAFAVRKNDKFEINDDIYNRLRAKIKGVPIYDIKKDIKNKVLTTSYLYI